MKILLKLTMLMILAISFLLSGCSSNVDTQKNAGEENEFPFKDKTYNLELGDEISIDNTFVDLKFTGIQEESLHFSDYVGSSKNIPYVVPAKINTSFQIPSSEKKLRAVIKEINYETNTITLFVQNRK